MADGNGQVSRKVSDLCLWERAEAVNDIQTGFDTS